jgi:beta-lactamase class A
MSILLLLGTMANCAGLAQAATAPFVHAPARSELKDSTPAAVAPETGGLAVTPDPAAVAIDALLAPEQGIYGVILMNPDGTLIYSRNAHTPFVSASLYKLILLADICRAIEHGDLTLETGLLIDLSYFTEVDAYDAYFSSDYAGSETTVEEALFATGAYSSNVAAKALLTLTSTEHLNATAADLGLHETFLFTDPESTPNWPPVANADLSAIDAKTVENLIMSYATDGQVNITTPADMARYFQLLLKGKIYNKRVSTMIANILGQQTIVNRFPALLPAGTKVVHKTGDLDFVVHDVGIIHTPGGTRVLAGMVEAPPDDERAAGVLQRLALIAYGATDVPPMPPFEPLVGDGTGRDSGEGAAGGYGSS